MNFVDILYSLPFVSPANLLLCSIAIAALLIYLPFLLVGVGRVQSGYDMGAPRAMLDKLPDYAKRATWAHQNSFESFILYAPAALMAFTVGLPAEQVAGTALIYIAARIAYAAFYIFDVPILRSLSWAISMGSIFSLYFNSIQAAFV